MADNGMFPEEAELYLPGPPAFSRVCVALALIPDDDVRAAIDRGLLWSAHCIRALPLRYRTECRWNTMHTCFYALAVASNMGAISLVRSR